MMMSEKSENVAKSKSNPGSVRSGVGRAAVILIICQAAFWVIWFSMLEATSSTDRGVRLFLLNHAPDELVVVNADNGQIEKRQAIADGLRQLVFSTDGKLAYISNAVDVTNKITVLDAHSFLIKERIEVDGIPQDLAIFPDNSRLIVVNGAKTDFMANGFDVYNLNQPAGSNKKSRAILYRAREMKLVEEVKIDNRTGLIYAIDSKNSKIWVYDFSRRELVDRIELNTAPIDMYFPPKGDYFFVSTIRREMIFVISRYSRKIVKRINVGRCRQITSNEDGSILYVPLLEVKQLALIDVNEGLKIGTVNIPRRCEVIEMGPFYERLYLIDTSGDGWLMALDISSMDLKNNTIKVLYEEKLFGNFRDIDVRPLGD
ncbi:hypothetical protein J7K50_05340 [bacterium]|nr:hypothetical protein [bacterium]